MKKAILLMTLVIAMIVIGCNKDPVSPKKQDAMIRLKSGSGLKDGAQIYFIALAKNNKFDTLSGDIFKYDKNQADWYIDGSEIPFTTAYKKFTKPIGEYYCLSITGRVLPGLIKSAMVSRIEVREGKQTFIIYASSGSIELDIDQP